MDSRSATEPAADGAGHPAPEPVLVGEVLRAHGLRGEVRILLHSDVPERFDCGRSLWLTAPNGRRQKVTIAGFRPVRGGALIRFRGIDDRDQAEAIRGFRLEVDATEVPAAPPGFYYHFELVGCRCFDEREGELGEVVEVLEDGGGSLLRVQGEDRTVLIPFVESFLAAVDVAAGRIDLRLPSGLVESCASEF